MKPDFALDLSLEAIALLHRAKRGWEEVGEARLDDPRLKGRLNALRAAALAECPDGMTTKLILPESQVLYTTVGCAEKDDKARRAEISRTLDGMTPYAIDDLAFDYEAEGEMLHVAVVARETLEEAESFAVEHGFNPVSIVARPKGGSFTGEPFFGSTGAAAGLLPKGAKVERDVLPTLVTLKLTTPVVPAPAPAAPEAGERDDEAERALQRALGELPDETEKKAADEAASPEAPAGNAPEAASPPAPASPPPEAGPAAKVGAESAPPSAEPPAAPASASAPEAAAEPL
ncbi:MAG: hypothetical protein OEM24_13560, partial [Paracoccaceae bacterium]|nr:hypothetical protein [Paracoccaceae bacterium]